MTKDDKEFLDRFIESYQINTNRFSCLVIAITDARKITGRNTLSGEHQMNILTSNEVFFNPFSFIGLINYLIILEMIGEIFSSKKIAINRLKTNTIYKALKQFSQGLNDRDIDTIIALRNSLAHNYGLINIPDAKEAETKQHKFTIRNFNADYLIKYPTEGKWSNDFTDKEEKTTTTVSYEKLVDLVEDVYRNLKSDNKKGLVTLALSQGMEELFARFTIKN